MTSNAQEPHKASYVQTHSSNCDTAEVCADSKLKTTFSLVKMLSIMMWYKHMISGSNADCVRHIWFRHIFDINTVIKCDLSISHIFGINTFMRWDLTKSHIFGMNPFMKWDLSISHICGINTLMRWDFSISHICGINTLMRWDLSISYIFGINTLMRWDLSISHDTKHEGKWYIFTRNSFDLRFCKGFCQQHFEIHIVGSHKTAVTPLLMHLSYCSLVLSHRYTTFNAKHYKIQIRKFCSFLKFHANLESPRPHKIILLTELLHIFEISLFYIL